MRKLIYKTGSGQSELYLDRSWEEVKELIPVDRTVIITDSNIALNYSDKFPDCKVLTLSPGEKTKSLSTIDQIVKELIKLEVDRSWFILGIGGGVVGDISGFIASVYMRGLSFGLVSTSLLSQVDASTGGKNGVNSGSYKNVIGCFTQPNFVFCDTSMLKTLPEDEFTSGLAEILKHALIRDKELFNLLEQESSKISPDNKSLMDKIVELSLKIKIAIVEKDERERGERRLLNFGHTIGHAIESAGGLKHGFAVAQGIYFSSLISLEEGKIDKEEFERIVRLLYDLKLISGTPRIQRNYIELIKGDKKREKDMIHLVLLDSIGKAFIKETPIQSLIKWMDKQL